MSEQTPGERFEEALAKLKAAGAEVGVLATGQGAFGWMMRGDLEKAHVTLSRLPPDRLAEVAVAAAALSALADEVAGGSKP